jgi:hypothetical protein
MSNTSHLLSASYNTPNSSHKFIGRLAYVGLLIATTGASLLYGDGIAHSGPCTVQIAQFERQIQNAGGPTAPQSVGAQLHHQPTVDAVQNAERKAAADATATLDRARQADADGNSVACAKAFDEAKHHWVIPSLS